MFVTSKIITMFAALNNTYQFTNAGRELASAVQAFFMSAHKRILYRYSCTPVWNCNGTTAFVKYVLSSGKGTSTFFIKPVVSCLTTTSLLLQPLCLAVQERVQLTKRARSTTSPAIHTRICHRWASPFMGVSFAISRSPMPTAIPSRGGSISLAAKRQPVPTLIKTLSSTWSVAMKSIVPMWPSADWPSSSCTRCWVHNSSLYYLILVRYYHFPDLRKMVAATAISKLS